MARSRWLTRMLWRSLVVSSLVLTLIVARPETSLACDCAGSGAGEPVVFQGLVLVVVPAGKLVRKLTREGQFSGSTLALLLVRDVQSGPRQPLFIVAGGYSADCYVYFHPGHIYSIFGEPRRFGVIQTTICDGSRDARW
ncbi:MAG: hypothetical protein U0031_01575 [Thermomicrobiales bacterium]